MICFAQVWLGFVILSGWFAAQSLGTFVAPGGMATSRGSLLNDGRVLITGGGYPPLANAELCDPSAGTFIFTGAVVSPRWHHTATLLSDGEVLIAASFFPRNAPIHMSAGFVGR